jgi:hypothetical protein
MKKREIPSSLASPAPRQARRRADHRKTATAAREILLKVGRPLGSSHIYSKLPQEIQEQIEPDKLHRVLARSKRAGLIYKNKLWSVRRSWIGKPERKHNRSSRGKLATARRTLDRACRVALDLMQASGATLHIDGIIRHIDDPHLDRRKLTRALWNRAQSQPNFRSAGGGFYFWVE